jgi:hypothetical protein
MPPVQEQSATLSALNTMLNKRGSETSLFEDANSDSITLDDTPITDSFFAGLDNIIDEATPLSALSANEMESSRRIRKKYGLDEPTASIRSSFSQGEILRRGRNYEREVQLLFETMQLVVRRFLEDMVSGGTVENEHPLLQPLLALIELSLYHGWRGDGSLFIPMSLWDFLIKAQKWSKSAASRMVMENVKQFGLRGSARIRAWIRLALMNRSLINDLTLLLSSESSLIS